MTGRVCCAGSWGVNPVNVGPEYCKYGEQNGWTNNKEYVEDEMCSIVLQELDEVSF